VGDVFTWTPRPLRLGANHGPAGRWNLIRFESVTWSLIYCQYNVFCAERGLSAAQYPGPVTGEITDVPILPLLTDHERLDTKNIPLTDIFDSWAAVTRNGIDIFDRSPRQML
jgi:hypothetical protein